MVPFWALISITWINSLGSGLLWSGVPFVTEGQYGFTKAQNLLLALVESVLYVVVAFSAGPLMRAYARKGLTARGWLAGVFVVQLVSSCLVLLGLWGVVVGACLLSVVGAALWPVMESYLSSGRHGHDMRRAIGVFNVAWMSATGAALLLMAPFTGTPAAAYSLLALLPVSVASLALLRAFPRQPAPHQPDEHHTHVPPGYSALLRASRFILPVSYVFISVLGPVLPYRMKALELEEWTKTPLTSLWMFARMGMVVLLAYYPFWHGKWSTIAVGVVLLAGGFGCAMLAPSAPVLVVGLAAFGIGHGILYYASLYYAMAVGSAAVDAGGVFEALIGVGYVIGPLAALAAGMSATGAGSDGQGQATLTLTVSCVAALGLTPAAWIWLRRPRHGGSVGAASPRRPHA